MKLPQVQQNAGPLHPDQVSALNALLASLTAEQAAWLSGYLAGVSAASVPGGVPSSASETVALAAESVTVMFGSQTGNSEGVAAELHSALVARGIPAVLKDMVNYKPQGLKAETTLLVVVSTHGEGDPPDNAMDLHAFLRSKRAPNLPGLRFAVLSLGDSSYEHFCKTGADFDNRLAELGATRLLDRVDCDLDYGTASEAWISAVVDKLSSATPVRASVVQPVAGPAGTIYSKKNPFPATLLERIQLNGRGSQKETVHLELSLEGSGLRYEPGDALGVVPTNAEPYVDELLHSLGFDPAASVTTYEGEQILRHAFLHLYEITTITRPFLRAYAELAKSKVLNERLGDAAALNAYLYGRELIDVVQEFPLPGLAPSVFLDMLRRLPPRLYSIASSLDAHPDEVHLCVGTTRYEAHGRRRMGVCSTYLADRVPVDGTVPVYVDANKNFKLPASPDTPVIMIGPGTGIAPFRAFVEQREIQGATRNWLFFGDQHFDTDFLYQTEWLQWLKSGVLQRLDVAFSRDQAQKVYVQHRMLERTAELAAWLKDGAHVYVCGDEKRMAHDVHETLITVLEQGAGMSRDAAVEEVKNMQKERRYQRDVY